MLPPGGVEVWFRLPSPNIFSLWALKQKLSVLIFFMISSLSVAPRRWALRPLYLIGSNGLTQLKPLPLDPAVDPASVAAN